MWTVTLLAWYNPLVSIKRKKEDKAMPTKDRLLVLLQTLQKNSDDETALTTADIFISYWDMPIIKDLNEVHSK